MQIRFDSQGILQPGVQSTIASWAPPQETGKFVFTSIGGTLGTVLTWPFVAFLMTHLGWVYAFYIPATIVLFTTVLWFYTVYNSPAEHPRIAEQEVKYIEASQGNTVSRTHVIKSIDLFAFAIFWWHFCLLCREVYLQSSVYWSQFHFGHFCSCTLVTCGRFTFYWLRLPSIWMRYDDLTSKSPKTDSKL